MCLYTVPEFPNFWAVERSSGARYITWRDPRYVFDVLHHAEDFCIFKRFWGSLPAQSTHLSLMKKPSPALLQEGWWRWEGWAGGGGGQQAGSTAGCYGIAAGTGKHV